MYQRFSRFDVRQQAYLAVPGEDEVESLRKKNIIFVISVRQSVFPDGTPPTLTLTGRIFFCGFVLGKCREKQSFYFNFGKKFRHFNTL
jgi:hypothetical protein